MAIEDEFIINLRKQKNELYTLAEKLENELNKKAKEINKHNDKFSATAFYNDFLISEWKCNDYYYIKVAHVNPLHKTVYYILDMSTSIQFLKQEKEYLKKYIDVLTLPHYRKIFDKYTEKIINLREKFSHK